MSLAQDEITINGQSLQLKGRMAINVQGLDLANQGKINEPYSNTISVASSRRNEEILGHVSDPGKRLDDTAAYDERKANIYIGGMLMMKNAKVSQITTGEEIKLNVVGKGVDFWKKLANKNLTDCAFADQSFVWGTGTFPRSSPGDLVVFPHIETYLPFDYTDISPVKGSMNYYYKLMRNEQLCPFISKYQTFQQIVEDAGYTFSWDYLRLNSDPGKRDSFKNSYITLRVPEGHPDFATSRAVYTQEWMPEMTQVDFIKGCLAQYGAYLVVQDNIVYMGIFDEIARKKGRSLDWSNKIDMSKTPNRTYDVGYAVENIWTYKNYEYKYRRILQDLFDMNPGLNMASRYSDTNGGVFSDNKNLDATREVMEIPWQPAMDFIGDNDEGSPRQCVYLPCFDYNANAFTDDYPTCDIVLPNDATTYKRVSTATESWSGGGTANGSIYAAWHHSQEIETTVTNSGEEHGLGFGKLEEHFYNDDATRFIRQPLKIDAQFFLRPTDIREFMAVNTNSFLRFIETLTLGENRIRSVYINELNGHFHVQKITSFTAGKPCQVTLIRL